MKTQTYTSTALDGTTHELSIGPSLLSLYPSSSVFYDNDGRAIDLGTVVDPHAGTVGLDWKKGKSGWDNRGGARIINIVASALNEGWIVTVRQSAHLFQGLWSGSVQVDVTLPGDALLTHVDTIVDGLVAKGDTRSPWRTSGGRPSDATAYTMTWIWHGDALVYERSLGRANGLRVDLEDGAIMQRPVDEKMTQDDVRSAIVTHNPQARITAREQAAAKRAATLAAVEGYDREARNGLRAALRTLRDEYVPEERERALQQGVKCWEDGQMDRAADYRDQVRAWGWADDAAALALQSEGKENEGGVITLEDALAGCLYIHPMNNDSHGRLLAAQYVADVLSRHGLRAHVGFSVTL